MMQIKKLQLKERFRFRLKLRDFPQIIYKIVPYVPDFVPFLFFFFNFYFENPCLQPPKNVPWNEARERVLVEA